MNTEVPVMMVKTDIASISMGVFVILFLMALVAGVVSVRMRSRPNSLPPTPLRPERAMSHSVRFQFAREFLWLVVPLVVITTFGMTTDPRRFVSLLNPSKLPTPPSAEQPEIPNPPAGAVVPVSTDDRSSVPETLARPTWCEQLRTREGETSLIVLASQQYSTRKEAELELRKAAQQLVQDDLRQIQIGSFHPHSWQPAADDVVAKAVKQQYDEVVQRDFGNFFHPMHRVWWQVELSPAVRAEFMPAIRADLVSFRILLVAIAASVFAMAASASLLYFQLDSLTQGQSRGLLKLLTGGVTAGWAGLVLSTLIYFARSSDQFQ